MGDEWDKRVFVVSNIKNYDPTKEPQDGHDYLRSVVVEKRQKYNEKVFLAPQSVVEAIPKKRVTILDQFAHLWTKETPVIPPGMKPTEEWEKDFLEKFIQIRSEIHDSEKEKKIALKSQGNIYTNIDVMAMLRSTFEDDEEEEYDEEEEEYDGYGEENVYEATEGAEIDALEHDEEYYAAQGFTEYNEGGDDDEENESFTNNEIVFQAPQKNNNKNKNNNQNQNNTPGKNAAKNKKKKKKKNKKKRNLINPMQQQVVDQYNYDDELKRLLDNGYFEIKEGEEGGKKEEERKVVDGEEKEERKQNEEEGERNENEEVEGMDVDNEINELIRMKRIEFDEKEQQQDQNVQQQNESILLQEQQDFVENNNNNNNNILKEEVYHSPKRKLDDLDVPAETDPVEVVPLSPKRRKTEKEGDNVEIEITHTTEIQEDDSNNISNNNDNNNDDNNDNNIDTNNTNDNNYDNNNIKKESPNVEIVDVDGLLHSQQQTQKNNNNNNNNNSNNINANKEKEHSNEPKPLFPHFNDHPAWKRLMLSPPTLAFIKELDELTNTNLLSLSLQWLRENNGVLTHREAQWFYFFFARLAEPLLLRNTASDLRELVLLFSTQRSTLADPTDPMKDELNGLIVIINKIFGQMI
jgi:hypothetical protein